MNPDRYTGAINSSNLRLSESLDDATVLIAAGYAKLKDPLPGLAITLMIRHDCGQNTEHHRAELIKMLQIRCTRRDMAVSEQRIGAAIDYWLNPACGPCGGRGHKQIPDTPAMEDVACNVCLGSGMKTHRFMDADYAEAMKRLGESINWAHRISAMLPSVEMDKKTVLELLT